MRPSMLKPGDTLGVVSPSWGGAGAFPHRLEQGIRAALALGFQVQLARHALGQAGYVSATPEQRAADIHELFADPQVRAIIAAIGGDHACQLLPLLDFALIQRNPKIFMGFSDITVLNVAIWRETGLVTFNGPMWLTDFAEHPAMFDYTLQAMRATLMRPEPAGPLRPASAWTEEFLDWELKEDLARPRRLQPSPGWSALKPGVAEGRLIGGCLESLQHLRGTRFWPDWQDALLFLETSEEAPSPATVDGILMDYENMGVFAQLRGLLVGRPMRYSDAEKQQLREILLERTRGFDFPIIADMDFGHTSPQLVLPIGCRARMDGATASLELLEAAVLG